ncbi:MAG: S41 family peptidase [Bacteroidota bacterium]
MRLDFSLFKYVLITTCLLYGCEKALIEEDPINTPVENFDIFWEELDRHYPFFELKQIDWDSVYALHRPSISNNTTPIDLFQTLESISLSLRDAHVNLYTPLGDVEYDFKAGFPVNSNIHAFNYTINRTQASRVVAYGDIINSNLGYITISSFGGERDDYRVIDDILELFKEKDGIIIDVRSNGGGSSLNSDIIATRFADEERLYRHIRYRNGPEQSDFSRWFDDSVKPRGSSQYTSPVVILTNRGCFSTTEDFILAMRTMPHVTIMGDTTGGGSGNPILRELPNGWAFRISTWMVVSPEFVAYEGIGIPPDTTIWINPNDSTAGRDTILEGAINLLN